MLRSFWRRWCRDIQRQRRGRVLRRAAGRVSSPAEVLEARRLLSNITVTTSLEHEAGKVSLREAITTANGSAGFDTIDFSPGLAGQTIHLTLGQLTITDTVAIKGLGAASTVIDAGGNSRVFDIAASAGDVTLDSLTVTGGKTTALADVGGGIRSLSPGTLSLVSSILSGNSTTGVSASGGGLYARDGNVKVIGGSVANNKTTGHDADGGALYARFGDVTISSGSISGNSTGAYNSDGGALFCRDGDLEIKDSTLSGNQASGSSARGGAIFAYESNVTLTASSVADNSTQGAGGDGGAIYIRYGDTTLTRSTLTGNSTAGTSADGGALFARDGDVAASDSDFSGNQVSGAYGRGGALFTYASDVTLTDSSVDGNASLGHDGIGGGAFLAFGSVTLTRSSVSENSTAEFRSKGGGLYASDVTLAIVESTIAANSTAGPYADGGGIYSINSALTLTNSTLSGNSTAKHDARGGGVFTYAGDLTLTSSTVSGNSTAELNSAGGGIFAQLGSLTIASSIVGGNTAAKSQGPDVSALVDIEFEATFSLIGVNQGTPLAPAPIGQPDAQGNLVGTVAVPIDPLLAPLADNAGPTQTMALLPGSPAYNGAGTSSALLYDQRGAPFARIVGGFLDMGAYEAQLVDTTPVTTIDAVEGQPIPGDSVLATFVSPNASAKAEDFVATVDWGTDRVTNVAIVIPNGSFEKPALPAYQFEYNPSVSSQGGTGWGFSGESGIVTHDGAFYMRTPPDGGQAAFLETYPGLPPGVFSQTVTIGADQAGFTALTFLTQGRQLYGANPFQVLLDGVPLVFGGSTTVTPPLGVFQRYTSDALQLTAGAHTLLFKGGPDVGLDLTSFVDAVAFAPTSRIVADPDYVGSGSGWKVIGNATYGEPGNYTITVQVTDGINSFTSTATSSAVADAPISNTTPSTTIGATAGQPLPFDTVLATFVDENPLAESTDYDIQIDWGASGIAPVVPNGDFELPALLPGIFQYNPTLVDQGGTGWTFTADSGVTGTNGDFFMHDPPSGRQAAFLESFPGHAQSIISQVLTVGAGQQGMTRLSFFAEGRSAYGANPFQVTLDGVMLTFNGSTTITPTTFDTFSYFSSDAFLLTPGTHTLSFLGQVPGDADLTTFIDAVRLNPFYHVVQDTSYSGPGSAWKVVGTVSYPAAGSHTPAVTVTSLADPSNTFTSTNLTIDVVDPESPARQLARQTGLAGFYFDPAGKLAQVMQNGSVLELVNGAGDASAGTLANETDIDVPGFDMTGVFDQTAGTITFTPNASGAIVAADAIVWTKVRQIAGQWLTSKGTVAGIRQLGADFNVTSGDGGKTTGHFVDATHLILDGWANPSGNLTGVLTNGGTRIEWANGNIWSLIPDFQGDWVNAGGNPTRIEQQGTSLLFVNKSGQTSLGKLIDPTHVQQGANWGGVVGEIVGNSIQFTNGTVWSIPGLTAGYPDLGGLWQTSNGGLDTRVLQADLALTFVNRLGQTSVGQFTSPTEVFAVDWNSHGTIVGDTIVWEVTTWTRIPYISGAYINQTNSETGINQLERSLKFTDKFGNVTHGTLVDPTHLVETDGGQRTAVISGGVITWSNGPVWTRLPELSGNWTVGGSFAPTYVEQAGVSVLMFAGTGKVLTGAFVAPGSLAVHETGIANPPTINVGVPSDHQLDFPDGPWTKFPPGVLDDVFANANFWPFV